MLNGALIGWLIETVVAHPARRNPKLMLVAFLKAWVQVTFAWEDHCPPIPDPRGGPPERILRVERMYDNYAEALDEVVVCVMSRADVHRFLLADARIGARITAILGERLVDLERRLSDTVFKNRPTADRHHPGDACRARATLRRQNAGNRSPHRWPIHHRSVPSSPLYTSRVPSPVVVSTIGSTTCGTGPRTSRKSTRLGAG
jgi:hypothetical protein